MNTICYINSLAWSDWLLDSISVNEDEERIEIKLVHYSDGMCVPDASATIFCDKFIGFALAGLHTAMNVDYLRINETGDLITESLQLIKNNYGELPSAFPFPFLWSCGEIKTLDSTWYQLDLKLIDGSIMKIACGGFNLELL